MNVKIDEECFNSAYLDFLNDYQHKFFILCGGAGSGKSVSCAQKVIITAFNNPGIRILILRKTLNSIKESCFKQILEILSDWKLLRFCVVNRTDLTITLPNGAELIFKGLEPDSERIKSIVGISIAFLDEATEFTEDDYTQITLRVRNPNYINQFYLACNPVSKSNWIYKRWFTPESKIDDDTYILKTTWRDNKFLSQTYIDTLNNLRYTSPVMWRVYSEGEWCSLDRLVYENWKIEDFDRTKLRGQHITGLDFGFVNDPSALVDSVADTDKKIIWVCREWAETGRTNAEIANVIKAMGLEKSDIVCDSAEPKSIEELRKAGIYRVKKSIKGPDSVLYGIQKLQQFQLIIHPNCTGIVEELRNYSWKKDKKSGEYLNEPIDDWNHRLDACRYSLDLLNKHTIQTFDKHLLGVR